MSYPYYTIVLCICKGKIKNIINFQKIPRFYLTKVIECGNLRVLTYRSGTTCMEFNGRNASIRRKEHVHGKKEDV